MAIAIVCDPCHAEEKLTLGHGWEITMKPPGAEKGETYRIVLGDDPHGKIAEKLWEMIQAHGEKVSGGTYEITSEAKAPAALAPPASPQTAEERPPAPPAPVAPPGPKEPTEREKKRDAALLFFNLLEKARQDQSIGVKPLENATRVYRSTQLRWQNGKGYPNPDQIARLASFLNLDRERVKHITGVEVPPWNPQKEEPEETKGEESAEVPSALFSDADIAATVEVLPVEEPKPYIPAPTSPNWADKLRARCMKVTTPFLSHPVPCGEVMPRDKMAGHVRNVHEAENVWEVPWDLVGMPAGLEPVRCPDCAMPFPTSNKLGNHMADGCPAARRRTPASSTSGKAFRKTKRGARAGH